MLYFYHNFCIEISHENLMVIKMQMQNEATVARILTWWRLYLQLVAWFWEGGLLDMESGSGEGSINPIAIF